jgi:hypothetical protein
MAAVPTSNPVTVVQSTESKQFWLAQGLGAGHEPDLEAADVLIVPVKDFREGVPFAFHQDTPALYRFLVAELGGLKVEICANDEEYVEVSLHSQSFRLSSIVVTYVAAPLLINLVSSYIYDHLKAKPTDAVEVSLVIEDHECKMFKFAFKGEAKDIHLLADQVGQLARDCEEKGGKKALPLKHKPK